MAVSTDSNLDIRQPNISLLLFLRLEVQFGLMKISIMMPSHSTHTILPRFCAAIATSFLDKSHQDDYESSNRDKSHQDDYESMSHLPSFP